MNDESSYAKWPSEPVDAKLIWNDHPVEGCGFLHFVGPDGNKAVVWVTRGPHGFNDHFLQNVWHVDESGDDLVVSPSIHFVGHFHSPNPVRFRKVDEL